MKVSETRIAFDFDVGDITRSPCRNCVGRCDFPACMDGCRILDRFQRILADTVSCVRESNPEHYRICRPLT